MKSFSRAGVTSIFAAMLLVIALLNFIGCMGGGGGGNTAVTSGKDIAGLTKSVNGFLASLNTQKSNEYLCPKLKSITTSEGGYYPLIVSDFGSDIKNPNDNATYSFSIPSNSIVQVGDFATLYAIATINGQEFRIDFKMIRIGGSWYIDEMTPTTTSSMYVTAKNLLPLQKNNNWKMIEIPTTSGNSLNSPSMKNSVIESEPLSGPEYWLTETYSSTNYSFDLSKYSSTLTALKQTDSWDILRATINQPSTDGTGLTDGTETPYTYPLSIRGIRTDTSSETGYSNVSGLYFFSQSTYNNGQSTLNDGSGIKILDPLSPIGYISTGTYDFTVDGTVYPIYIASRLARKITIQTFAGPFSAYQIDMFSRFTSSIPLLSYHQDGYYSVLVAEDKGFVGEVYWDHNASATDILLLYSSVVNGQTTPAQDTGMDANLGTFAFSQTSPLGAIVNATYTKQLITGGKTPYSISLASGTLPNGISCDNTGLLSGVPSTLGTYSFDLLATDFYNQEITKTYVMTVNEPLSFTGTYQATASMNVAFSMDMVSGGVGSYHFTTDSGALPAGLQYQGAGLSGTPTDAGTFNFTVTVTDEANETLTSSFTITVTDSLSLLPASTSLVAEEGISYSKNIVFGGTKPYSIATSTSFPTDFSFDSDGLLTSSGPSSVGTYTFSVYVTDAGGNSASQTYSLYVAPTFKFINLDPLPDGTTGVNYDMVVATGGALPYANESVPNGSLPPGMTFENNKLSGIPTATGSYLFKLSIDDSYGVTLSSTFNLTIHEGLSFTQPTNLPDITPNNAYSVELVKGGIAPYQIEITSGTLPIGIATFTNTTSAGLSGTTSQNGDFSFEASVTDSANQTITKTFTVHSGIAMVPQIEWQKCLGGTIGNDTTEIGRRIRQTSDGGYIIGGITTSADGDMPVTGGGNSIALVKVDSSGNILWERTYGGSGDDVLWDLIVCTNGDIAFAGGTKSGDGDLAGYPSNDSNNYYDAWFARIDPTNGKILWQTRYGGNYDDCFTSVVEGIAGDFIAVGYSNSTTNVPSHYGSSSNPDVLLVKISNTDQGAIMTEKIFGGTGSDMPERMIGNLSGELTIVGKTDSTDNDFSNDPPNGGTDVMFIHTNSNLDIQYAHTFGGIGTDLAYDVLSADDDSGYVIAGSSTSNDHDVTSNAGGSDMWIFKTDLTGSSVIWNKTLGGTFQEVAYGINEMPDGTFNIVGSVGSSDGGIISGQHGNWDTWLTQIDASGNFNWQLCLGGTHSEEGRDIIETADGKNALIGYTKSNDGDVSGNHAVNYSDWWVVKLK